MEPKMVSLQVAIMVPVYRRDHCGAEAAASFQGAHLPRWNQISSGFDGLPRPVDFRCYESCCGYSASHDVALGLVAPDCFSKDVYAIPRPNHLHASDVRLPLGWFQQNVKTVSARGIESHCGSTLYCPDCVPK